jgi:hypothetical protein
MMVLDINSNELARKLTIYTTSWWVKSQGLFDEGLYRDEIVICRVESSFGILEKVAEEQFVRLPIGFLVFEAYLQESSQNNAPQRFVCGK